MAVHFSDGFESNDFSAWDATEEIGASNTITTSSTQAKVGTYAAKVHIEDAVTNDVARARDYDALNQGSGATIFASAWWFFPTGFESETSHWVMMKVRELNSPFDGFEVKMNSSEQLYIVDDVNSTYYLQDSPIVVPTNQWVGIELEIYVHNSAGYIKLRQDGVVIITQTGIDTLPAANYTAIEVGLNIGGSNWTGPDDFYFDEVYVQDSQKIPAPTVDETAARIKGVIQRDLDETATRIKGVIYYGVDQTASRIKGVIQRDYTATALRIKGTIWRLIHETFNSDIRALTADAEQTATRIKGKISLPVTALLNSDIRGQDGIINYIRIKGAISNSATQTAARIKGVISGPHTETALRIKGFILGEPEVNVLRVKGAISHDVVDTIRIKGVIKQDYSASALRIKGVIWNQVSAIRIKGKILRTVDDTPLRIKGTLLPVFDQPVLRIKGSIIYGVEHAHTRIKGKIHGTIDTIRIKGSIIYGVDDSALRIKGSIGTPSAASALRIKGIIQSDGTQTALRIKGQIGKKRPVEFEKQDSWFVKDDTERFDKKDWPFETRER